MENNSSNWVNKPIRPWFVAHIKDLQQRICTALEDLDGQAKFHSDKWERPGGGGGDTRVIADGAVWEKGGVNISEVHGAVTDIMRRELKLQGESFFATGISLVIHPRNPHVPTVHANFRYFELYDAEGKVIRNWLGGGADLTPYYLVEKDVKHFHGTLKQACDPFGEELYPKYKSECDRYFANHHRAEETRGVGGIFFDGLSPDREEGDRYYLGFSHACSEAFLPAYLPIAAANKDKPYTEAQQYWQEIRRGRYTEFNLLHDRGTLFGIRTNGRTESILMSLPPRVRFVYDYQPEPGSEEEALLDVCRNPRKWVEPI
jgi:coproporphyrinogen III oxidase